MITHAVKWARGQPVGGPVEYAVLLALAHEVDRHGVCERSVREIADEVNTDRTTVRRVLDRLSGRGLVSWKQGHSGTRNIYRLPLPDRSD